MADKIYILEMVGGKQKRITIPESWKVSFGPLVPGTRQVGDGAGGATFRVYESKEKQRACFVGVREFREASIPIEERIVKTKTQTIHAQTPEGMRDFVVSANVAEWRNPDDTHPVEEAFTALPSIEDFSFSPEGGE